ncbi:hypothetical protein FLL45_19855 [Aliikangiella marina]|uniref:Uncharacterized protein n=1 Tax=Aliikangiella marina TaxID=1712262 RepID=A0A545T2H5_9GAMM|nr:hypothetical protein [Aliikangiella marina]TQV71413.1 hypothetical protein FLL45_19855 [Aliikangiella marina]
MGKAGVVEVFHRFDFRSDIVVDIYEPIIGEYVWLSMYLGAPFRNGALSKDLVKYLLFELKGKHHIHWFKCLNSFKELSKELEWKTKGSSPFFEECMASVAPNLNTKTHYHQIFKEILKYKKLTSCPELLTYSDRSNQLKAVKLINNHFNVELAQK